jgi:plasmid maintenance system killer protein
MRIRFNSDYLFDLYKGRPVHGKPRYSQEIIKQFKKTITQLTSIENIPALFRVRNLNFENLNGGYYSVRVNKQYRIILTIDKDEILIEDIIVIEDLSKHYE